MPVSPTDSDPRYHVSLTDGTTELSFVLYNQAGKKNHTAITATPLDQSPIKTSSDMYADSYVRMLARAEEAKAKHPVKLPPRPSVKIFTFSRDYSQEDEPSKVYL